MREGCWWCKTKEGYKHKSAKSAPAELGNPAGAFDKTILLQALIGFFEPLTYSVDFSISLKILAIEQKALWRVRLNSASELHTYKGG